MAKKPGAEFDIDAVRGMGEHIGAQNAEDGFEYRDGHEAEDQNVDAKFDTLLAALRARGTFQNPEQLQLVMRQNEDLRKDIKKIITLLLRDDRDAQLKAERERVQRLLEQLKEIIAKYSDPKQSPLHFEVKKNSEFFDIQIQ